MEQGDLALNGISELPFEPLIVYTQTFGYVRKRKLQIVAESDTRKYRASKLII